MKKPAWLRVRIGSNSECSRTREILRRNNLHTVCEEALCPNLGECWGNGRATIMILGGTCTRNCKFCNVGTEHPAPPDPDEPQRVANAVKETRLNDVVITSVTRDDLPDGGAWLWAETIRLVHNAVPGITVEALVPDFQGSMDAIKTVADAHPEIFGHNLETVPSLYKTARPQADYEQSLNVLRMAHDLGMITKTSIMAGLGETDAEILAVMRDAHDADCDIFFIGQYLQPTREHLPIREYLTPEHFESLKQQGLEMGFRVVVSAPLVRSSYYSKEQTDFLKKLSAGNRKLKEFASRQSDR